MDSNTSKASPHTLRCAVVSDSNIVYDWMCDLSSKIIDHDYFVQAYMANLENPNIHYRIACDADGTKVGFVSLHIQHLIHASVPIGEIQELYVAESCRSRGVGKILVHDILNIARQEGLFRVDVACNCIRERAHAFYEREGFTRTHYKFTQSL